MDKRINEAVAMNRSGSSCSASVLKAFCEEAGLSAAEAGRIASPMAAGRMGVCGAVLAADYVMKSKGLGDKVIEKVFAAEVGSAQCREIRRNGLLPCVKCVQKASELLAKELSK